MKFSFVDVLLIVGSLLFGYGLWNINHNIAYMAIGIEMAIIGFIGSRNEYNS